MTNAQHTPTPYYAEDDNGWKVMVTTVWMGEERPLAVASHLKKEDAAFIVTACNAHYKLIYACKEAVKLLNAYGISVPGIDATITEADAAA
jgi:hypothetical protein